MLAVLIGMLLPCYSRNRSKDAVGFANGEGEGGIWELISVSGGAGTRSSLSATRELLGQTEMEDFHYKER